MTEIPDFIQKKPWADYYPDEVSPEIDIPDKTFVEFTEEKIDEFEDRNALIYKEEEYTYGELRERAYSFANGLEKLGMGKEDCVGIYMRNSPDWASAYHGSMMAGCRVTGLSPLFSPRELKYQITDSETKTLVLDEGFFPVLQEVIEDVDLENIIVCSEGEPDIDVEHETMAEMLDNKPERPDVKIEQDDIAVLQYTGGTTGLPKGCMLTQKNVLSNVYQNYQWYEYLVNKLETEKIKAVSLLPWYHIFGQTCELNTSLTAGTCAVIVPEFDAEKTMEIIEDYQCQMFLGVPTMFNLIAAHPKFEEYDLSCLDWVISGAAPLPYDTYKKFKETHGITICNGYGLSEACPVTHATPPLSEPRVRDGVLSVSLTYPNTLSAIIDVNKDEPEFLPPGEEGELVVSGPQVMKGYWKMPDETEKVFFEAGGRKWLRTGDIAVMDEDGYTYPVDREKDMITYKGHSVFPREIEEIYFEHPDVADIAVIGIPDEVAGETIKAFIVPNEGADKDELKDYGKQNLAGYKYPREIEFIEQIPKTDAGKYLKRELREREEEKAEG